MRARLITAAFGAVLLGLVASWYVLRAGHRDAAASPAYATLAQGRRVVFRDTSAAHRGQLSTVALADPGAPRDQAALTCDRVYAAGGTVVCLRPVGPLRTYQAVVMDAALLQRWTIPLVGVPNRARISPSGRLVAWTVFVTADS